MNKKNNYGFTIVELLSVIVVLGIILVIAVPRIMSAVNDSKKRALLNSAESIVRKVSEMVLINNAEESKYIISNKQFIGSSLEVNGQLPTDGSIYIDENGKTALLLSEGNFCALKNFNNNKIEIFDNKVECFLNVPEPVPESCFIYIKDDVNLEIKITGYNSLHKDCTKNLLIPEKIEGLPVTTIGNSAFRGKGLTSVSLPNTIKNIESWGFLQNNLKKIKIPEGVETITDASFMDNQLEEVIIPTSVKNIEIRAFNNNKLPDDSAFIYQRNADGTINYKNVASYGGARRDNVIVPTGVEVIERFSMYSNDITSVVLPQGLLRINSWSFWRNSLADLTIPSSVTTI